MGKHSAPAPKCPVCNGGTITVKTDGDGKADNEQQTQTVPCSTCDGTGEA